LEAEVRSLYFRDLAARHSRYKQIVTGVSFFLSSGAAATLVAKLPNWVPLVLALIVAVLTAYSMSINLDKKVLTLAKLHHQWNRLEADYERLWNRWYQDGAEEEYEALVKRASEASETATAEAPYDEKLIEKWTSFVYERYQPTTA
jgi:hypothetical protein